MISVPRKLHDRLESLRELNVQPAINPIARMHIYYCIYLCESMFVYHSPGMVKMNKEDRIDAMSAIPKTVMAHIDTLHEKLRAIDIERFVDQPLVDAFLVPGKSLDNGQQTYKNISLPVSDNGTINSVDLEVFYKTLSGYSEIIPNITNKAPRKRTSSNGYEYCVYDVQSLRVQTLFATLVKICDQHIEMINQIGSCSQPQPVA